MIIRINTKTNERRELTVRELFNMMADPDTAKRMGEAQWPQSMGKTQQPLAIVYTYTPDE